MGTDGVGFDCGLFERENEMSGEAANWRRLGTEQRGDGSKPQFGTN
jgi:hypothetical protein